MASGGKCTAAMRFGRVLQVVAASPPPALPGASLVALARLGSGTGREGRALRGEQAGKGLHVEHPR